MWVDFQNLTFRKKFSEKGVTITPTIQFGRHPQDCGLFIEMLSRQLGGLSNGLSNLLGKQRQRRKNQRRKWESRVFEVIRPA